MYYREVIFSKIKSKNEKKVKGTNLVGYCNRDCIGHGKTFIFSMQLMLMIKWDNSILLSG